VPVRIKGRECETGDGDSPNCWGLRCGYQCQVFVLRVMMEKWEEDAMGRVDREENPWRARNKAQESGVRGVTIIKYTMNRDTRWRGLYGGCGWGKVKRWMEMRDMENESIVPPKKPLSPQAMRCSQTTKRFFFRSMGEKRARG